MGKLKIAASNDSGGMPAPAIEPAVIVFGRDEAKKAHASVFGEADAALAEKAAGLMGYKVVRVATAEARTAALALPLGRVFASGRGFVPFCKEAAFTVLAGLPGAFQPPVPAEPEPEPLPEVTSTPQRWEDIAAGAMVLATTGEDGEGWFEAIVIEDRGEGLVILRWRDWPNETSFVRRLDGLALLPAMAAAEA